MEASSLGACSWGCGLFLWGCGFDVWRLKQEHLWCVFFSIFPLGFGEVVGEILEEVELLGVKGTQVGKEFLLWFFRFVFLKESDTTRDTVVSRCAFNLSVAHTL